MKIHGRKNFIIFIFTVSTLFFSQQLFAKKTEDFDFVMSVDKTKVYVGESIRVKFVFKHKSDLKIAEANFAPPVFTNFWVKPGKNAPNTIKNGYNIYTLHYLITPQKAGFLRIEPARMDIGLLKFGQKNTLRFERIKWKSIFSNALEVEAIGLPENLTLFGDYNISASVDKTVITANEPVNLTIKIFGNGNIDEIDDFTITNKNAEVFSDTSKRKNISQNGKKIAQMIQRFAFVSDKNFTIEPISIKFFDANSKKIKTISTDPIKITVTNQKKENIKKLQKESTMPTPGTTSPSYLILVAITSFLAGIFIASFYKKRRREKKRANLPIELKIKKAKNDKSLLHLLLPYTGKSKDLDKIIRYLEENLYETKTHKIDKKALAKNFKEYVTIRDEYINL